MIKIGTYQSYPSRYDYGGKTITHKGVHVTTSINTEIEQVITQIPGGIPYQKAHCIPTVEHRPDKISNIFFDTSEFWWYIQLFNNISDPFEGFNSGDRVLIPVVEGL
jgi:hypothetical protein